MAVGYLFVKLALLFLGFVAVMKATGIVAQLLDISSPYNESLRVWGSKASGTCVNAPLAMDWCWWKFSEIFLATLLLWCLLWCQAPWASSRRQGHTTPQPNPNTRLLDVERLKGIPPYLPNGWFRICDSDDVQVREVKTVNLLHHRIAVFRGVSEHLFAVDPYCPHLGADLTMGGKVVGNCIRCPFHGWLLSGRTGECLNVPYSKTRPPQQIASKTWTITEVNKIVYLWYHADGTPPLYDPMVVKEIDSGAWRCHGVQTYMIRCHIEDIAENAADVNHLKPVHEPFMAEGSDLRSIARRSGPIQFRHIWTMDWHAEKAPDTHIGLWSMSHYSTLFGRRMPGTTVSIFAKQIGPGSSVVAFKSWLWGTIVILHEVTPLEPLLQRMTHHIWSHPAVPSLVAKIFYWIHDKQVDRDVMIWNSKAYRDKPPLPSEDVMIARHRNWYKQFYCESSPTVTRATTNLDW